MDTEMREVPDFPDYLITQDGFVWSKRWGRFIRRSPTQSGTLTVRLISPYGDNRQHVLTVSRLVLYVWSAERYPSDFNTVMYLDGDKNNCHIDNLVFRRRHIAIKYYQEMGRPSRREFPRGLRVVGSRRTFEDQKELAMVYGVLPSDVESSVLTGRYVYPGEFQVELV